MGDDHNDRIEELLWKQIDGAITPSEREQIEADLASRPEARASQRQLNALTRVLEAVEQVEPPQSLREELRRAVAARESSTAERSSWVNTVQRLFQSRRALRFAYLAAGVLIGLVGYRLLDAGLKHGGPIDVSKFYGTANLQRPPLPQKALRLELPDDKGALALYRDGSVLAADLRQSLEHESHLALGLRNGSLRLKRFKQKGGLASQVQTDENQLTVEMTGPGRYFLVAAVAPSTRSITVRVGTPRGALVDREVSMQKIPEIPGATTNF